MAFREKIRKPLGAQSTGILTSQIAAQPTVPAISLDSRLTSPVTRSQLNNSQKEFPARDELGPRPLSQVGNFSRRLDLYNSLNLLENPTEENEEPAELSPSSANKNLFEPPVRRSKRSTERKDYWKMQNPK